MRLDFGNWTQRLLSVEHLKLDIDNPRFSYFSLIPQHYYKIFFLST